MYNKIKNPVTNRFVTIKSKLGKMILEKYLNQLGGTNKCGINPETKRCSKKFGHITPELCEINQSTDRCIKVKQKKKYKIKYDN